MRIRYVILLALLSSVTVHSVRCHAQQDTETRVLFQTTAGDFTVKLYNGTPIHRDNFVRLVQEHYYDSLLFHRVIRDFMIQSGDPDSRNAVRLEHLGTGGPDYELPAEISPSRYFHRYGALCAARKVNQVNPELLSSGSQFFIVTGQTYRAYQLHAIEDELNGEMRRKLFDRLWTQYSDSVFAMELRNDDDSKYNLRKALIARVDSVIAEQGPVKFTDEQMNVYMSLGGTPKLDGDYTVFGQVTDGMKTVDKIQRVMTDANDRPLKDIRIISARIIEE